MKISMETVSTESIVSECQKEINKRLNATKESIIE